MTHPGAAAIRGRARKTGRTSAGRDPARGWRRRRLPARRGPPGSPPPAAPSPPPLGGISCGLRGAGAGAAMPVPSLGSPRPGLASPPRIPSAVPAAGFSASSHVRVARGGGSAPRRKGSVSFPSRRLTPVLHPQTVVRRQAGAASPEAARALGPAAVPAPRPVPEERRPGSAGGFRSPNSVQGTAGWLSPKHLASHLFHFPSDFSLLEGWFWVFFF